MKSNLTDLTILSPNCNKPRTEIITRITPHIMVAKWTAKQAGEYFAKASVKKSANYGIGIDGEVGCYVEEENRAWTSGSRYNDHRAITIECASEMVRPYVVNEKVWEKLKLLCYDIAFRYGYKKLVFSESDYEQLEKSGLMVLTVHRWFQATECCGDYMYKRLGQLADEVTNQLCYNIKNSPVIIPDEIFPKVFQVKIDNLNIREKPTTSSKSKGYTGKGYFTINERSGDWGKLKSGAGWIYLSNSNWVEEAKGQSLGTNVKALSGLYRIKKDGVAVRKSPSFASPVTVKAKAGVYTIVETNGGWGKLKSNAGWIYLEYEGWIEKIK